MKRKLKNSELGRLNKEDFKLRKKQPIVLILDNVRSMHNVGSVFRTSDAFLIEEILLCGVTGTPPHKEIEKTALGATETVKWRKCSSTLEAIREMKSRNYRVCAVEQAEGSQPLNGIREDEQPLALVFGNEVYGVEQEVMDECDEVMEIPQLGSKHSLNIAVSVGIVLWELLRSKMKDHPIEARTNFTSL